MNFNNLAYQLQIDGWTVYGPGMHNGMPFDLVGQRKCNLSQWNILVKTVPVLDIAATMVWKNNFTYLSNAAKSWWWGKCFVLCLVAQQIAPEALYTLQGDSFGLFGVFRMKGGGGRIMIADESTRQVYGKVPSVPLDAHKMTESTKRILYFALNQP